MYLTRKFAVAIGCVALFSQPAHAAGLNKNNKPDDGRFSMSVGGTYDTGSYGDTIDTDVWSIPVGLKYTKGPLTLSASTSWLRIKGPNNVDSEGNFIGSAAGVSTTHSGIGDLYLSATYNLLDDVAYPVGMDVAGKIKLPTADEKKFLGSGEIDYGLNVEFYKTIASFTPYWNIGYKWKGDPSGINYNNVWNTTIGADFKVTKDLLIGADYFQQRKVTRFSDDDKEFSIYGNYYLDNSNKVNLYILGGSGNSSPDWGTGATLVHYF
jgi:hypothetical protein